MSLIASRVGSPIVSPVMGSNVDMMLDNVWIYDQTGPVLRISDRPDCTVSCDVDGLIYINFASPLLSTEYLSFYPSIPYKTIYMSCRPRCAEYVVADTMDVRIAGSWEDGTKLSPRPRTNVVSYTKSVIFGATSTGPHTVDGPGGGQVQAVRVTLPNAGGGLYPGLQCWLHGAPYPAGAPASLWVRRVGGTGDVIRLLHGGTPSGDPLDTFPLIGTWQRLGKTTRIPHYYWGCGLYPGDTGAEIEVACMQFGTDGRWIPLPFSNSAPVTETDYVYDAATRTLTLARPLDTGGVLVVNGQTAIQLDAYSWRF